MSFPSHDATHLSARDLEELGSHLGVFARKRACFFKAGDQREQPSQERKRNIDRVFTTLIINCTYSQYADRTEQVCHSKSIDNKKEISSVTCGAAPHNFDLNDELH